MTVPPVWARRAFWICIAAVLVLALMPNERQPTTGWDKANHLLAFGTLAVLGLASWPERVRAVAAALVGYGVLIELLQALTPHRSGDWVDVVADSCGIVVGWLAWTAWKSLRRRAA
ncbi:VanZ family protein [Ramlibacter sp.]|uniref:VanZ family protein n=1 Tax=Ramlibacter sp. TaxID=1917967 RepID=UPI003D112598